MPEARHCLRSVRHEGGELMGGQAGKISQKAKDAFGRQRYQAQKRGIEWNLSLEQWWDFWQSSGYWDQRGRGQGYVMCRRGDTGPYEIGNIFIALCRHNSSNRRGKKSKLPIGVWKDRGKFGAKRMIGGKSYYLGSFDNPVDAHNAYLRAGLNIQIQARETA